MTPSSTDEDADGAFLGTNRPQLYLRRRRRRRQQRHVGPSVHFVAFLVSAVTALAYTNSNPLFTSMASKSPQLRHSMAILTRSAGKDDEDKSVMKKNDENKSEQQAMKKSNREVEDDDDDDGEEDEDSGWLTWMVSGRKRGSAEIKMRDPEELGGVPRSERYSSKYVFFFT